MLIYIRSTLLFFLLGIVSMAHAASIEATGQAFLVDGDLGKAREQAINDAKRQASLQAAAYISSTQQLSNGILEIDNMRVSTLSTIRDIEVLDEKLFGNKLHVRIRAEVEVDTACENGGSGNSFRKTVAVSAFPVEQPAQKNLGGFRHIDSLLAKQLVERINRHPNLSALNAGHLQLQNPLSTAATHQLDNGALTTLMRHGQQLDTQYIVSGVVRDLSMVDPSVMQEENLFVSTYNRLDYKSDKHLRNFAIDLYIHDGFSGALIDQFSLATQGRWTLQPNQQTGFATPAFYEQAYGKAVADLLKDAAKQITEKLRCMPFSARITAAENNRLWIASGQRSGLKVGDKLSVYRKSVMYNASGPATTELINTQQTLTISDVQATSASGFIEGSTSQHNIQIDDIVIFW